MKMKSNVPSLPRGFYKNQRGIGLLEMMLVFVIIAAILLITVRFYQSTKIGQNIANTISLTGDIHKASVAYAKRKDFTELSAKKLQDAGLLSTAQIVNPWGGMVSVQGVNNNTQVQIMFANIPLSACMDLEARLKTTTRGSSEAADCSGTILTVKYDLF